MGQKTRNPSSSLAYHAQVASAGGDNPNYGGAMFKAMCGVVASGIRKVALTRQPLGTVLRLLDSFPK